MQLLKGMFKPNLIIQGGPVLNVNNSPFESPSKNKLTYVIYDKINISYKSLCSQFSYLPDKLKDFSLENWLENLKNCRYSFQISWNTLVVKIDCSHEKLLYLAFLTTNSHIPTLKIDLDTKKWLLTNEKWNLK